MSATFGGFNRSEPALPERPLRLRSTWAALREHWGPWVGSFCVFIGVCFFPSIWILQAPWKDGLLADVISASAIFVAYLLTAATVLPALEDRPLIRKFRLWGYYDRIVNYIARSAYAAGFLLLLSLSAIILPTILSAIIPSIGGVLPAWLSGHQLSNRLFSAFWWASLSLMASFTFVATRTLMGMLRLPKD
jgi:hypothetical protein